MGDDLDKGQGGRGVVPTTAPDLARTGRSATPRGPLNNRVTVPDRVAAYLDRPGLLEKVDPRRHGLTLLKAPAGFGKTVLLSESCRNLGNAGTMAAWLTLEAADSPQRFDACLTLAFERAGLNVPDELRAPDVDWRRPGVLEYRTELLGMAIERHGAACVLVLDALERLGDSRALGLLDLLLNHGPPNLHVAVGCREIPKSLDVASLILAGRSQVFSAVDLRFSRREVAQFLGLRVSGRQAVSVARESGGWPIALRMLRNERVDGTPERTEGIDVADNWMESRLLRGLPDTDRELLLDAGLFDWFDARLLDEVLGTSGAKRRVEAIPALAGLLEAADGAASGALCLHALLREHCAKRRLRETPNRFRRIHRGIAKALARRGEVAAAMGHAAEAADPGLMADILEDAGGVWLWLREGFASLQAADQLLTDELLAERPRLALVRCLVTLLGGRLDEARAMYSGLAAGPPDGVPDAGDGGLANQPDGTLVGGMLLLYACEPVASAQARAVIARERRFATDERLDPLTRSSFEHSMAIAHNLTGEFGTAHGWAERALCRVPRGDYLEVYIDLARGQIAMAQGEVLQATRCYGRALGRVREDYPRDPGPTALGEALLAELNLERNRLAGVRVASGDPAAHFEGAVSFVACAARAGVVLDATRERQDVDAAVSVAEGMLDHARRAALTMLVRYVAAERVSLLVARGSIEEAERAWRVDGLPGKVAECLDLKVQSWREMEAVACAKLRLLTARREFAAARRLFDDLLSVAAGRDLWRTRMRALALGVALEWRAEGPAAAQRHLGGFLQLFAHADYARPLLREGAACLPALEAFVADNTDAPQAGVAQGLLATLTAGERPQPTFSPREVEVLRRLESCSDKEIARALSLTPRGVRYHVANIFGKLEVRDRHKAVMRAREISLLP